MTRLINIIIKIFLFFFIIVIYLFRPLKIIRFCVLPSKRIGHWVKNIELYLCYERNTSKYLDIFCAGGVVSNKYYLKILKRKIFILPRFIVQNFFNLNSFISDYINIFKIHNFQLNQERDFKNLVYKKEPFFYLNDDEKKRGKEFLEKFNMKLGDKYVCLCVRDSMYLKKTFPNKDFSYHDYRDHDIENFYLMADTLTNLGYRVFRMGNAVEKPFNNGNKKIIDYASLEIQNDFYDIFLFANCEFVISTSLGVDEFALTFRKPLITCVVPFIGFKTYSEKIMNFSKHHFSKKLNRNLKFSEMLNFFENKNHNIHLAENFLKNGIVFKENSPEEWNLMALEMIDRIKNIPIQNDEKKGVVKTKENKKDYKYGSRTQTKVGKKRYIPSSSSKLVFNRFVRFR